MASKLSLLLPLLIILVPLLSHPSCEARPMSPFMAEMMAIAGELSSMGRNIDTLGGIKNSGPSPGDGHSNGYMFVNGGIKDAGPSPGDGHSNGYKFVNGGIKDAGPSPGDGHNNGYMFVNGGIKDAGPSPGGGGHKFIAVDTVEGIKNSGPSPRGGGH